VIINASPEVLAEWGKYLMDFQERVFPTFSPYGFTVAEAFLVWRINELNNNIIDVETAVKELTDG
jgi:hypothetical protein